MTFVVGGERNGTRVRAGKVALDVAMTSLLTFLGSAAV